MNDNIISNMNNVMQYQKHPAYWIEVWYDDNIKMWVRTVDINQLTDEGHTDFPSAYHRYKDDAETDAVHLAYDIMDKHRDAKVVKQTYTKAGKLAYAISPEQYRRAHAKTRRYDYDGGEQ